MARLGHILAWFGFHRWRDIDFDEGWTLQECAWSGKRRSVVYGYNMRAIKPHREPKWLVPTPPSRPSNEAGE